MNNRISSQSGEGLKDKIPLLCGMIAIAPAVLATVNVVYAALYSLTLLLVTIITGMLSYLIFGVKRTILSRVVFMIVASGFVSAAEAVLPHVGIELSDNFALALLLIVPASLLIFESNEREGFLHNLIGNVQSGFGYGIAIVVFAFVRELLSTENIFSIGGKGGVTVFANWFTPLEVLGHPAGAFILLAIMGAVWCSFVRARAEAKCERARELDEIRRGEHDTLIFDEDRGVIVRRSTLERVQRERVIADESEMIDLTIFEEMFDISDTDSDEIEGDGEDYDYE